MLDSYNVTFHFLIIKGQVIHQSFAETVSGNFRLKLRL